MNIPLIDLHLQYESIKKDIDAAIESVIGDAAFIGGKRVAEFEEAFARFCGARHCVGVGNGTDALYIVLKNLGIGAGDEVITAANTFIATAEAVTLTGARVVFVDCENDTYTIDPQQAEKAITERTKAVIPVHLYGHPASMMELSKIAKEHSLHLIEDAAQAHGSEINGNRAGSLSSAACFSFYPGKNLGAYGDAGAIVTNDDELATRCRMFANHGRVQKYEHQFEGSNSRLDGLQAAILKAKLRYLEEWTERRHAAACLYNELLQDTALVTPVEKTGVRHVYHLYVVRMKERDRVQRILKEKGVSTGIHYPIALPNLQAYQYLGHRPEDFPVANQFCEEILSLPMFPEITRSQIEYVCSTIKEALWC